ncbi:uncharacterized protein CCOS01_04966, partial [Colletotrichum costaricense]
TAAHGAELQSPDSSHSARLSSSVRDRHLGVRIIGATLSNKTPGYAYASSPSVSLRQAINTGGCHSHHHPDKLTASFPAILPRSPNHAPIKLPHARFCRPAKDLDSAGYMPSVRLSEPQPRITVTHGHPRELLFWPVPWPS